MPVFPRRLVMVIAVMLSSNMVLRAQDTTPEATPNIEITPEAADTAPCMVHTESAHSVSVRVGPGTNRTSFIFLPADEDFEVLGKAEDDAGGVWWKLDRAIVAPKKSAAEAWVAQEDVTATGDCEAVLDVNAPPIIPISAPPNAPETTPEAGSDTSGVEAITPLAGTWTIVYPANAAGSCAKGSKTVSLNLDWPPESWSLTVSGGSLTYAGKAFARSAANANQYSGQTQITRLGNTPIPARFTLRVTSETQIAATLTFVYTMQDAACSFSVSASMSRG
ncbi:MAG: hypothetical protein ABI690_07030 [Chloroflexota bacterium]